MIQMESLRMTDRHFRLAYKVNGNLKASEKLNTAQILLFADA